MLSRILLFVAIFALSAPPSLAAPAPELVHPKNILPVTAIYVAKGAIDSCGSGCDRWIAVEGKLDPAAATRLQSFLRTQKNAKLPIYLYSPGGDVRQAMSMGRMLRERKATGRVARTVVKECAADQQAEPACLKLKQSGRELEAELSTSGAFCNSACVYLLFGATTREVEPRVTLGVHSARVTVSYSGKGPVPSEALRAQASRQALARLDGDIASYATAMGVDRGLLDVVRRTKFDQMHPLTREEMFRFGIDGRELVETAWRYNDQGTRSSVDKVVQERTPTHPNDFRTLHWRLSCLEGGHVRLGYLRTNRSDSVVSVALRFGADQKIAFSAVTITPQAEIRSVRVDGGTVEKLKAAARLTSMEVGPAKDGAEAAAHETILSTDGLARSIDALLQSCRGAAGQVPAAPTESR
jgi:hypothetical protein